MKMVRYDPFRDIEQFEQEISKLWNKNLGLIPSSVESATMDMYEEDGNLIAEAILPNFSKGEVSVTTDQDVLQVTAEHTEKKEDKGKRRYFFKESSNRYIRRVALPQGVDSSKTKASFKDGVLKVSMPITPKKQPKSVDIK